MIYATHYTKRRLTAVLATPLPRILPLLFFVKICLHKQVHPIIQLKTKRIKTAQHIYTQHFICGIWLNFNAKPGEHMIHNHKIGPYKQQKKR